MLPICSFCVYLTPLPGQVMIEKGKGWDDRGGPAAGCGFCAICLEKIAMQDMALVNGCEHAYWFVCNVSFHVHTDLAVPSSNSCLCLCIHYLFTVGSVTCILRWASYNEKPSCPQCSLDGRKAARPLLNHQLSRQLSDDDAGSGSSRGQKKKEASKDVTGRRAKRVLKREAAAAKHQLTSSSFLFQCL
ncbi:hypothetical protein BHM03_00040219 [Ensete ventricosum]|nr:hypothetical protein BHM03_00040219 [Ensete ventricosum]